MAKKKPTTKPTTKKPPRPERTWTITYRDVATPNPTRYTAHEMNTYGEWVEFMWFMDDSWVTTLAIPVDLMFRVELVRDEPQPV